MKMYVKGGYIVLDFKYFPAIITAVKTITGRRYDPKTKKWMVPKEHVEEVVAKLIPAFRFVMSGEVRDLLAEAKASKEKMERVRIDPSMYKGNYPLYDFQKIGSVFLREIGNPLLGDAPGLGKTLQTISALTEGTEYKKILILCPASLKYNWAEEIEKWCDFTHQVIDGSKSERDVQWKRYSKFTIANYELLLRDFEEMRKAQFDVIVCDEATRIANPRAKSVKELKKLYPKKRIALTGTPVSNSPLDIYGIVEWLKPGYLGTYTQFKERYVVVEPKWGKVVSYKNLDHLAGLVRPLMLRRKKEEVLNDFPAKTLENITFNLGREETKIYEGIQKMLWEEISKLDIKNKGSMALVPVKMLRLKQAADHLGLIKKGSTTSSKLDALKDVLDPVIKSGEKAIVFTQFAEMAKILHQELISRYSPKTPNDPSNIYLIYGDVESEDRQKFVNEFNEREGAAVIIMTEAGAYGLNLQSASYVVHYDLPWSIAKMEQREDRAHRIGQTKPVTVYNLIAAGTIDEYVAKTLQNKSQMSVDILQDAERMEESGLSEEDIKNILRIK